MGKEILSGIKSGIRFLMEKLSVIFGVFSFFLFGCAHRSYQVTDHCDGQRFYNLDPDARASKSIFDILRWKLFGQPGDWPKVKMDKKWSPEPHPPLLDSEVKITFVNYATVLIEWKGFSLLTDPVFSENLGPFEFLNLRRFQDPGVAFDELPTIDYVFVSHSHYDHLDLPSIQRLEDRFHPRYIVPLGMGSLLPKEACKRVKELDWWESFEDSEQDFKITLVPSQHWSKRSLFDTNRTLWGGAVLKQKNRVIYFPGDTGYGEHFKMIRSRLGPIDIAFIPIGAYEPRWFMKSSHLNPLDAVLAHIDLDSQQSIAIHFGTFHLSDESFDDPERELGEALKLKSIPISKFLSPQNGQVFYFK